MKEDFAVADSLEEDVKAVRAELQRLNSHRFIQMHDKPLRVIGFNFVRGLAFGLGTFLGASILLSVAASALAQIDFIPIVGDWASEIASEMQAVADQGAEQTGQ